MRTTATTAMEMMGWRGRALVQELDRRLEAVWEQANDDLDRGLEIPVVEETWRWWQHWRERAEELLEIGLDLADGEPDGVTWEKFVSQAIAEIDWDIEALKRVREALAAPWPQTEETTATA